jgi:hypothetical protein
MMSTRAGVSLLRRGCMEHVPNREDKPKSLIVVLHIALVPASRNNKGVKLIRQQRSIMRGCEVHPLNQRWAVPCHAQSFRYRSLRAGAAQQMTLKLPPMGNLLNINKALHRPLPGAAANTCSSHHVLHRQERPSPVSFWLYSLTWECR